MDLNVVFGVITIIAFVFSIYQHFETKTNSKIEEFKAITLLQRIQNAKLSAVTSVEASNMIVQLCKKEDTNLKELINLARVSRGNLFNLIKLLEEEEVKLSAWEYGGFKSLNKNNSNVSNEN